MRKIIIIFSFILLSVSQLWAQVSKEVEVTKSYMPTVAKAEKPLIKANISDTTTINPDIDYSITPLSINTQLQTRPINPATVTYWEFNNPATAQVKVGAGYPLNSLLQAHASTHNASVGYLAANIDHRGNYSNITSSLGNKVNATEILNSGTVGGGLYIGQQTLSGDISYSNDIYHNYAFNQYKSPFINYQRLSTGLKFGDDFVDLSRVNYSVKGSYSHFVDGLSNANNLVDIGGKLGYKITLGELFLSSDYQLINSGYNYLSQLLNISTSISMLMDDWQLRLGLDYYYDKTHLDNSSPSHNYIIPDVLMYKKLSTIVSPFVQLNGSVSQNSFAHLSQINPYVESGLGDKSSADYNLLVGLMGNNKLSTLNYKAYFGYTIGRNNRFWALNIINEPSDQTTDIYDCYFDLSLANLNTASLNVDVTYSPINNLSLMLDAHYFQYSKASSAKYINSQASFISSFGAEYLLRDVKVGLRGKLVTNRDFTVQYMSNSSSEVSSSEIVTLPTVVDLSAYIEWQMNKRTSVFVEGDNLCNVNLYPWPLYRGYGARFTAGVKMYFR